MLKQLLSEGLLTVKQRKKIKLRRTESFISEITGEALMYVTESRFKWTSLSSEVLLTVKQRENQVKRDWVIDLLEYWRSTDICY